MQTKRTIVFLLTVIIVSALVLSGCAAEPTTTSTSAPQNTTAPMDMPTSAPAAANEGLPDTAAEAGSSQAATVSYHLITSLGAEGMTYLGVGGEIDGIHNPELKANAGDTVVITLENGDGVQHDFNITEFNAASEMVTTKGTQTTVTFTAGQPGEYDYFCSMPGHRQAGMEGKFLVGGTADDTAAQPQPTDDTSYTGSMGDMNSAPAAAGPADPNAVSIVRPPDDLPGPLPVRGPETIQIALETVEVSGVLADGTTYSYWTFDGLVPGPFLRVRVGDTVELSLTNNASSTMAHSIDLHAVTGPGGGAAVTQAGPGETKMVTFKALNPGLYVYHCATPSVATHIANGMFGLILVEPEGGLPPVDHEYYVMQSEIYTAGTFGTAGHQSFDYQAMLDENPQYFVLNGAVGALTDQHPLTANTGETVRIFFGVGGPNFTSSFHVIGEIFDRVFNLASLTAAPLTDVQTTLVPPGGATMVEFEVQVPGRYLLVDHALSRLERGLVGYLIVEGEPAPDIFDGEMTPGSGH